MVYLVVSILHSLANTPEVVESSFAQKKTEKARHCDGRNMCRASCTYEAYIYSVLEFLSKFSTS